MLFVGSASLDGYVDDLVKIQDHGVSINGIEIPVTDGPITEGRKYTTTIDLIQYLDLINVRNEFGGGAFNSARAAKRTLKADTTYFDLSRSRVDGLEVCASDHLNSEQIGAYFHGSRPLPFNLVLHLNGDKVILKSPMKNPDVNLHGIEEFETFASQTDKIAFNSVKVQGLVEKILTYHEEKQILGGITHSLDPDFVLEKVLPYVPCQFNFEELGYIMSKDHQDYVCERGNADVAIEDLRKIGMDYNRETGMYVTLGSNGVLFLDHDNKSRPEVYHLRLRDHVGEGLKEYIIAHEKSTNGAGDAFFGGLVANLDRDPYHTALHASQTAILHITGYRMDPAKFEVKKVG